MEDEDFTDRMVELLYGELPADEEAAMRAHLERSEVARKAFDRLREGQALASQLTLEEPPAGLLDGVLAAAREVAAERVTESTEAPEPARRAAAPREPVEDDETGPWGQFLQWIGGFAARPQFAMAMMLFLMIGIGMWYLPDFRGNDPTDSQAIIDPAPGDEVGPSALQPAEPLALEADPRTGRIRPRDEIDHTPRPRPQPPADAPEPSPVADRDDSEEPQEAQLAIAPSDLQGQGVSMDEDGAGEVITAPLVDPRASGAEAMMAPGEAHRPAIERVQGRPSPAPVQAPSSIRPTVETDSLPEPNGAPSTATARFRSGMQHYQAREYRAAADDFTAVMEGPDTDARRLLPSAMHHRARSEAAIRNCAAAVRTYEQLLSRYRAYSGASEAMVEAAQCYQRLGRLSAARRWLERAAGASQAAVAQRARRELTVLAARERAAERAAGADEATPAEAASSEVAPTSME